MNRLIRNVALATATQHKRALHDWRHSDCNVIPRRFLCGGRCGTIRMSLHDFAKRFGDPHEAAPAAEWRKYDTLPLLDGAGKVSAIWWFQTPRGAVQVSDFWWNKPDELSIRALDTRCLRWFLRWCKLRGIPVE